MKIDVVSLGQRLIAATIPSSTYQRARRYAQESQGPKIWKGRGSRDSAGRLEPPRTPAHQSRQQTVFLIGRIKNRRHHTLASPRRSVVGVRRGQGQAGPGAALMDSKGREHAGAGQGAGSGWAAVPPRGRPFGLGSLSASWHPRGKPKWQRLDSPTHKVRILITDTTGWHSPRVTTRRLLPRQLR